jgi:hypothetical protein
LCFHVTRDPDRRSKTIATPLQWRVSTVALIQATDSGTGILPGQLLAILSLAVVIAYPLSFAVLRRYRRTLLRSMHTGSDRQLAEHLASSENSASPDQLTQTGADLVVLDRDSTIATGAPAETLYSEVLRAPWRAAAIYAVAGFCFAAVMAAAFLIPIGFSPFRYLLIFWIFTWPVVLTVNLVATVTWRARLATATFYFLVFAVLGAITLIRSPDSSWGQLITLWLIINLPITFLLLTALNLRLRAVGPLVVTFMILEIDEVINLVPLGRVVFVVDDTTDEEFLRRTVQRSWDEADLAEPLRHGRATPPFPVQGLGRRFTTTSPYHMRRCLGNS